MSNIGDSNDLYKEIIFSSNKRNFGTNSDPIFLLKQPMLIKKYKVKEIQIPLSNYLINDTNNRLYYTENYLHETAGSTAITTSSMITLTNGTYTVAQYISHLATTLNADSSLTNLTSGSTGLTTGSQYTIGNNAITNTINILPSGLNNYIKLDFLNKDYTHENILGFPNNIDTSRSGFDGTSASSLTSTNVYDFSGNNIVHIGSNNINSGIDFLNSNYNILASVPITNAYNGINYYTNTNGGYIDINQNLSEVSLFLRDERDRDVDLNGKSWVMTLSVIY